MRRGTELSGAGILAALVLLSLWGFVPLPERAFASSYYPHLPIFIGCGDYGCTGFTADNGVTGGSGTTSDPYIIEGWDIKGGIEISGTTAHFTIRNVYVHGGVGISLTDASNGRIEYSIVSNNNPGGISLTHSSEISLVGNRLVNNTRGISIQRSNDVIATDNTLSNSGALAVWDDSLNATLKGNVLTGNRQVVLGTVDMLVANGLIVYGQTGDPVGSHTITQDNLVNGKPVLYYKNCDGLDVDGVDAGELILADCSNVTVAHLQITDPNFALDLLFVRNTQIISNNLYSVLGTYSSGLVFQGNNITTGGTELDWLTDGSLTNNLFGSTSNIRFSRNVTVRGNHFNTSVVLTDSTNFTFNENIFGNGGGVGFYPDRGTTNIFVYHNSYLSGGVAEALALTNILTRTNYWDAGYPGGGNYYSYGYTGVDKCSGPDQNICTGPDGIGDTPHGEDRYPLMRPYTPTGTPPVASFSFTPAAPILSQVVTFNASRSYDPDGSIAGYYWDWGDTLAESSGTNPQATHRYLVRGNYTVTLFVADNTRAVAFKQRPISIASSTGKPVACFTPSPDTATVGSSIKFDGSCSYDSSGTIISYSWDFGDGSRDTGAAVSHTYASAGSYVVTLTVTDDKGATAASTKTVTIAPLNQPPVAVLNVDRRTASTFETFIADGSSSYDPDGRITAYRIDWGDGSWNATAKATHQYARAGTYTVTLTVTDDRGASGQASVGLTVRDRPPTAAFTFSPIKPFVGDQVHFDGSGSADLDGSITSYRWDFGDGTGATGPTASHSYGAPDTYTVALTVTDNAGLMNFTLLRLTAAQRTLSVQPSGDFDYLSRETVRIRIAALVKDSSTGDPLSNATVRIQIYDDAGQLWASGPMVEQPASTGFYVWSSSSTIKDMGLRKGVYSVLVQASYRGGPVAHAGLLFHVDPPVEDANGPPYYSLCLLAAVGFASAGATALALKRRSVARALGGLRRRP